MCSERNVIFSLLSLLFSFKEKYSKKQNKTKNQYQQFIFLIKRLVSLENVVIIRYVAENHPNILWIFFFLVPVDQT